MKFFFFSLILMRTAFAGPEIILSPLDHLYVPKGFDSNDTVEVVITGSFPNPCFSRNQVKVSVRNDVIDITVTALEPDLGLKSSHSFCPDMVVPFKEVVSVGNLQGGDYDIVVNRQAGLKALRDSLIIGEASSSAIDDNIYEAVEWMEQKSKNEFILHAVRFSPCYVLKEVKVVSNHKDTLSILPIMKQVSDFCPMKAVPTSYPVKLDFKDLKVDKPLLHVRTLDGKSVNAIVDQRMR